jgi:Uma2 family endonuclease
MKRMATAAPLFPPGAPAQNSPEVEAAFASAPPEMVAEILEGKLSLMPRPRPRHARAALRLARRLGSLDDEGGGWVFLMEPELHLGEGPDKLVPDIAAWRRERLPELPDDAAIRLAPDWVCEVLSDGTRRLDRGKKQRIYAREQVGHLWFVDPEAQILEVFERVGQQWLLIDTFEAEAAVRAPPFAAIDVDLAALWAR